MSAIGVTSIHAPLKSSVAPKTAASQQGTYRGQKVRLAQSKNSLLSDAMEEIGDVLSDRIDEDQRKKERVREKGSATFEKTKTVRAIMDAMRDEDFEQQFKAFKGKLTRMKNAGLGHFNAELENHFGDVTHQMMALDALKEELKGTDSPFYDHATHALDELMKQHGAEVLAGLNINELVTHTSGKNSQEAQEKRDFYRDTILGYDGLTQSYQQLIERYGEEGLPEKVDFLIKALGDDVSADNPSQDKNTLKMVLDELYQLETLVTLHEGCRVSLRHLHASNPSFKVRAPSVFMKELLELAGADWVDKSQVTNFLHRMEARAPLEEIHLLRETRRLIERLPAKSYRNADQRDTILDSIKQAQDDAIERDYEEDQ